MKALGVCSERQISGDFARRDSEHWSGERRAYRTPRLPTRGAPVHDGSAEYECPENRSRRSASGRPAMGSKM
jgi:hypothetical protein